MNDVSGTRALQDLDRDYEAALDWIAGLVKLHGASRLRLYAPYIKEMSDAERAGQLEELTSNGKNSDRLTAAYEAVEIVDIHRGLQNYREPGLAERLRFVVQGDFDATKEDPERSTNKPRNTSFELYTAAMFSCAGFQVDLESLTDVKVAFFDRTLFVECKRPQSFRGLEKGLKEARDQIKKRFPDGSDEKNLGLIAINATKVINPKAEIREAAIPGSHGFPNLSEVTRDFGLGNIKPFKRVLATSPHVLAVDIIFSSIVSNQHGGMGVRSGQTHIHNHKPGTIMAQYVTRLSQARNDALSKINQ